MKTFWAAVGGVIGSVLLPVLAVVLIRVASAHSGPWTSVTICDDHTLTFYQRNFPTILFGSFFVTLTLGFVGGFFLTRQLLRFPKV
jgi:hypothetical protein